MQPREAVKDLSLGIFKTKLDKALENSFVGNNPALAMKDCLFLYMNMGVANTFWRL